MWKWIRLAVDKVSLKMWKRFGWLWIKMEEMDLAGRGIGWMAYFEKKELPV